MGVLNILIIDDNSVDRATYKHMLKTHFDRPYKVYEAINRSEALIALNENNIDLILLDYNLTNANGIELMKTIHRHVNKHIPTIMVTGEGNENIAVTALKAGASDYLTKDSLKSSQLINAINSALKHAKTVPAKSNASTYIIAFASFTIIVIALVALAGWYTNNTVLFQVKTHYSPMQYNTAISFIFLGLSLLMIYRFPYIAFFLVSLVLILSALTLCEYLFHISLGIDQLFMKSYVTVYTPYAGRMAPNTSLCFVLSSIAILCITKVIQFRYQIIFEMLLTSVVLVIALIAFIGYAANFPIEYGWGKLTGMGLLTVINFIITSICLLILNLQSFKTNEQIIQNYIPSFVLFTGCVFFLLLWRALEDEQFNQLKKEITQDEISIQHTFYDKLDFYKAALPRINYRLELDKDISKTEWLADTEGYLHDMRSYSMISVLDSKENIKWFVKKSDISVQDEQDIVNYCLPKKVESGISSSYFSTFTNNLKYLCILKHSSYGYLQGLINIPMFINELTEELDLQDYSVNLTRANMPQVINTYPELTMSFPLAGIDDSVTMQIIPNNHRISSGKSVYTWLALVSGILTTILLSYSLRLWATSKKREQVLLAETKLREILESRFQLITTSANDAIIMLDHEDKIVFWNQAATKILGFDLHDALNQKAHELLVPKRYWESYNRRFRTFRDTGAGPMLGRPIEMIVNNKEGIELPVEISISGVKVGSNWEAIAIMRDLTERKKAEAIIYHQANYDALTDLPNRMLFNLLLKNTISQAHRLKSPLYILSLDLDGFKAVNDEYGHEIGDLLLKEVANRLMHTVRETDAVARLGGDEFMIILTNILHKDQVKIITNKIINELGKPILITKQPILIGASVGIVNYPEDADNIKDLLLKADQAMYRAKRAGKNTYIFYSE